MGEREQEIADTGREDRGRGRWRTRKRVQGGSKSREAEDRAGIRRPNKAKQGDDEEAAGGRITGETEWAEDKAGERERETRGEAEVACVCVLPLFKKRFVN